MPSIPNPQPPIQSPLGVHGSIVRILEESTGQPWWSPAPACRVNFDERPAQQEMYPAINVKSDGTGGPEYGFERNKSKDYSLTIEVYGRSLEEAEQLGEAVERAFERGDGPIDDGTAAESRVASLIATDPDCVSITDSGGEKYQTETRWGPDSSRTVRGELHWKVMIRRTF